jgi:hypothetical protein
MLVLQTSQEGYEQLIEDLSDRPERLTYDRGRLERLHGQSMRSKRFIERIIDALGEG